MPTPKEIHDILELIINPLRDEIARLEKNLSALEVIVAQNLARQDDSRAELRDDLQGHVHHYHI